MESVYQFYGMLEHVNTNRDGMNWDRTGGTKERNVFLNTSPYIPDIAQRAIR